MRLAITGTHRNGKTTLAEAAGLLLPRFAVEPEPYEQLLESGDEFLDDGGPESFLVQLRHLVGRLAVTRPTDDVIFDRSPLDFVAYIMASDELQLGRTRGSIEPGVLELASAGLASLELIAFLPLRREAGPSHRRSLRRLADGHLRDIVLSDSLGLLAAPDAPAVMQLTGSTARRVAELIAAVEPSADHTFERGRT